MRRDRPRDNQEGQAYVVSYRVSKNLLTNFHFRIAYIEFANRESALKAKHLNESLFKGRQLTVMPKRKNKPGMSTGRGGFNMRGGSPMAMMMMLSRFMQGRGMRGSVRGTRGGFRGGRGRGGDPSVAGQEQK